MLLVAYCLSFCPVTYCPWVSVCFPVALSTLTAKSSPILRNNLLLVKCTKYSSGRSSTVAEYPFVSVPCPFANWHACLTTDLLGEIPAQAAMNTPLRTSNVATRICLQYTVLLLFTLMLSSPAVPE